MNRTLFKPNNVDREFRKHFDGAAGDEFREIVWAERIPSVMLELHAHECQEMYDVTSKYTGADGRPLAELRHMVRCPYCYMRLAGRVGL